LQRIGPPIDSTRPVPPLTSRRWPWPEGPARSPPVQAGDIPAPVAAASLKHPAAMAVQSCLRSSRRAAKGRPGDGNAPRPDRSERLFRIFSASSSAEVLRRPLESAQYTAPTFGGRCREAGVRSSMGSVGDAYDNAMCESFFATLECELLARRQFTSQAEAKMWSSATSRAVQAGPPSFRHQLSVTDRL
jgi:transposase InsO family protein